MAEPKNVVRCEPKGMQDYRWLLEVQLIPGKMHPKLIVILKKPSKATETRSDPTVGKVEAWARRHGFASITYFNLYARRGTDPLSIAGLSDADMIGSETDQYIKAAIDSMQPGDKVVAAWGNPNGLDPVRYAQRASAVVKLVGQEKLYVMGYLTGKENPTHGKNWNHEPELQPWPGARSGKSDTRRRCP